MIDLKKIAKENNKSGTIELRQKPLSKLESVKYFRELNKLTKAMRLDIRKELLPLLKSLNSQYASDGYADQLSKVIKQLSMKYSNLTEIFAKGAAQKMVTTIATINQKVFLNQVNKKIGVNLEGVLVDEGMSDFLEAQVNKNISLIKSVPDEYFKAIETTVMNGAVNGLRWEDIAREIGGIKDISSVNGKLQNRIKLIARNETSNINAAISKKRQEDLGVKKFKWETSQDERTRESHLVLDGKVFEWKNLPIVDGVKTSPGRPINCRCVAIPVIEI